MKNFKVEIDLKVWDRAYSIVSKQRMAYDIDDPDKPEAVWAAMGEAAGHWVSTAVLSAIVAAIEEPDPPKKNSGKRTKKRTLKLLDPNNPGNNAPGEHSG